MDLLNERTRVVEEIGRVKREARCPSTSPSARTRCSPTSPARTAGPITQEAIRRVFERIIDEMRTIQRLRMEAGLAPAQGGRHRSMIVVMQQGATEPQIQAVIDRMVEMGFDVHRSTGVIHTVLGGVGGKGEFDLAIFEVMEGVKEAHRIASPYKLASRGFRPGGTVVRVRRRGDRRRAGGGDGRTVQRGEPRAD